MLGDTHRCKNLPPVGGESLVGPAIVCGMEDLVVVMAIVWLVSGEAHSLLALRYCCDGSPGS